MTTTVVILVESISFGGVGRDSGACNSCLGAESVLAGGWRLSLLTAVAVCSHHREALASPDVPGITHILNRGEGGRDCWYPFFPFWGLTTGALWEGALKSIPLHKGPFWMGIPGILPASPPSTPNYPDRSTMGLPHWNSVFPAKVQPERTSGALTGRIWGSLTVLSGFSTLRGVTAVCAAAEDSTGPTGRKHIQLSGSSANPDASIIHCAVKACQRKYGFWNGI